MSTDNRTELNDADSVTGWTSDGASPSLNTDTGQRYEGTGSIDGQHTNSDEATYTTTIGGTRNLADATVYFLVKDNLLETFANGGVQGMLFDGTDRIGYDMGGNDAPGLDLEPFYRGYKLDVSVIVATPGSFATYAGTEANLAQTAITGVGVGTLHLAKAVGNVPNIFIDRMTFIANDSYALTINGGTVGTPETTADVQSDDATNGWGMVAQPKTGQFDFFAPTEWGNSAPTADTYFSASDETWFWIGDNNGGGHTVGATHFPFRYVGNATDTTDITWANLVIVNIGTRAEFNMNDTNVDVDWDNVTLTDVGAITFATAAVSRTHDIVTFNNCAQVTPNGCNGSDWTFNGTTDANGAMLFDTSGDSDDLVGVDFVSDGTGHAIEISVAGTYNFDNFTFSGYGADGTTDAAVYISANVAVTINIQNGGDTPTVRNSGTAPTINNAVTVRVDGVAEGTSVKVIANETVGTITKGDVILEKFADSNGVAERTDFNYESAFDPSGLDVLIRARNQGIAVAAIAEDGGVFTDETEEANSAVTGDMTLSPATPAVNDAYYFGAAETFDAVKVIVDATVTGQSWNWEYYNGTGWSSLSGGSVSPPPTTVSQALNTAGEQTISWTVPGNWATTTINSQGPLYYIRARIFAITTPNQSTGRECQLNTTLYLPIPPSGVLERTITSAGLTATLSQAVDSISRPFG